MGSFSARSQSARSGLIVITLVIAVIAVGWFVVWPSYQGVKNENRLLTERKTAASSKEQTLKDVEKLLENYKKNQEEVANIITALPQSPQIPQLLYDIETISLQSSMLLQDIQITDATALSAEDSQASDTPEATSEDRFTASELVKLRVTIVVAGRIESLPVLLDLLQRNIRLFDVEQVTIEGDVSSENEVPRFNITLFAYYQK